MIIVQILLKNIKYILLSVLLVFCLLITGCSQQLYRYSAPIEAQHYPVLNYKLIELINALPKSMPTTMEQAQTLFNNQLYLKDKNEYFSFYEGGPFLTQDRVIITSANIAVKNKRMIPVESIGFSFDQKQCVNTEFLNKTFGFHIISLLTPHELDNPLIRYSINLEGSSFGVSTELNNKDCATSIGVALR